MESIAKVWESLLEFLRGKNWVGALVIFAFIMIFLTRGDNSDCAAALAAERALARAREDVLNEKMEKFKTEVLIQTQTDKAKSDAKFEALLLSRQEGGTSEKELNEIRALQKVNNELAKKIESKSNQN